MADLYTTSIATDSLVLTLGHDVTGSLATACGDYTVTVTNDGGGRLSYDSINNQLVLTPLSTIDSYGPSPGGVQVGFVNYSGVTDYTPNLTVACELT